MSIDKKIDELIQAINNNTAALEKLAAPKVSEVKATNASEKSEKTAQAGLGEKTKTPTRAQASAQNAAEKAAPAKEEVKTEKAEPVDLDAEKAERSRICQTLFGALKGKLGSKAAKETTRMAIDSFLGKPTKATEDITHEQHKAFIAHMQKAIDRAQQ